MSGGLTGHHRKEILRGTACPMFSKDLNPHCDMAYFPKSSVSRLNQTLLNSGRSFFTHEILKARNISVVSTYHTYLLYLNDLNIPNNSENITLCTRLTKTRAEICFY